jgi:hypothetical protein
MFKRKFKAPRPASPPAWAISIALVLALAFAQTSPRAHADNATPATRPAPRILLVRYSILLNETGIDAVKQLDSQPVKSDSKVYDGTIYNADALRGAIAQAKDSSGLEAGDPNVDFALPIAGALNLQRPLQVQSWQDRDTRVTVNGSANGNETWTDAGSQIHGKLKYQTIHLDLNESDNRSQATPSVEGSITFDGNLAAGQALAFIAPITAGSGNVYDHLIIWEAFNVEPWQVAYLQSIQDSIWWCQNGPDQAIDMVNNAVVWAARATHDADHSPDAYQQKLEDGKIVAVAAICNLQKWPLCFWDGTGQPVYEPQQIDLNPYNISDPSQTWVTLHGDVSEWKAASPLGKTQQAANTNPYTYADTFDVDPTGQVVIGIPTGPWKLLGEIKPGGSVMINGSKYKFHKLESTGDTGIYAQFYTNRGAIYGDPAVALTAVLKNDTEVDADQPAMNLIGLGWGTNQPQFSSITKDQVKTFHVWTRKQQWITIANVPDQPADEPKADATQPDADAAQASLESRFPVARRNLGNAPVAVAAAQSATSEQLQKWESIAPDPKTPLGAMRAYLIAAKNGDAEGVRRRIIAEPQTDPKFLDLMCRHTAATCYLQAEEIAHFGREKVATLEQIDSTFNTPDPELAVAAVTWIPQSDGGLRSSDGITISRGSDGEYYLDWTWVFAQFPPGNAANVIQEKLREQLICARQLDQFLKQNPSTTFDQYVQEMIAVKSQVDATGSGSPSTNPAATENSAPPSR